MEFDGGRREDVEIIIIASIRMTFTEMDKVSQFSPRAGVCVTIKRPRTARHVLAGVRRREAA